MDIQNLTTVTARDLARDQKRVFNDVLTLGRPVIVTNHNVAKVAIVDMKVLQLMERETALQKTRNLLEMAKEAEALSKKYKIKGPKDLSTNHDKYTWGLYE